MSKTEIEILGMIAGALGFTGYLCGIYFVSKNRSFPSPTACLIGFISSVLNALSHYLMDDSASINYLPLAFVPGAALLLCYTYRQQKRLVAPKFTDWFSIAVAALTIAIWINTSNHALANALLQIILTVAYMPIIGGILSGRVREIWWAWSPSLAAFTLDLFAAWACYDGNWIIFLFPARGFALTGAVMLFARLCPNLHLIVRNDY